MRYSKIIRRLLAISVLYTSIILAFGSAKYPIWLEALQQFVVPLSTVLAGYFAVDSIKNYKKKD